MPVNMILLLIPLLPLFSFLLLGIGGKKYLGKSAGIIASIFMLLSTAMAGYTAYGYFFVYGQQGGVYQTLHPIVYQWLSFTPTLSIDMGYLLDPISVMMLLVVTFISLMVHIYSLAYLKGDERMPVYYAFLGLFTFSMLGLVVSSNIFQMYIFWELVGLSSFLLIGYYYNKPAAVAACKIAFIVTRFADLGFLIGILILSFYADTLDFSTLIQRLTSPESTELKLAVTASFLGVSALTWGLVLVFIGGAGKSAMFPLHIWLPDAMEGPTPVSALIHAATMVVAGVFLVARLFPVMAISAPLVLQIIAVVGIFSACFAAVIACTQTDIKRVLAYSTMSQIGYMIFALGVSGYGGEAGLGYTASMFHLFTHALFKALLFLGAGSVIHYVHSNEVMDMGGLKKYLPVTHACFLIGCLAIAGIPPFAGFFSKEEILLAAYQNNRAIYWLALITSAITAFYMFRLYFLIFWNKPAHAHADHHGEGAFTMKLPLLLLALGALGAGFIPFSTFVSADAIPFHTELHLGFSVLPVLLAVAGISIAAVFYRKQTEWPQKISTQLGGIYQTIYRKFYIDEVYLFITKKIIFNLVARPAAWIDKNIIDGLVNETGNSTEFVADKIKGMQSGKVQQYAVYFLAGAIGLALLFIYVWK